MFAAADCASEREHRLSGLASSQMVDTLDSAGQRGGHAGVAFDSTGNIYDFRCMKQGTWLAMQFCREVHVHSTTLNSVKPAPLSPYSSQFGIGSAKVGICGVVFVHYSRGWGKGIRDC